MSEVTVKERVQIFIDLIEDCPELFSEYKNELMELANGITDDIESLFNNISAWCRKDGHENIDKLFAQRIKEKSGIEEGNRFPKNKQAIENLSTERYTNAVQVSIPEKEEDKDENQSD